MKNINPDRLPVVGILPSLKVGGGVSFALKFFNKLSESHSCSLNLVLWRTNSEEESSATKSVYLCSLNAQRSIAFISYFYILMKFILHLFFNRESRASSLWVFTHFSTYPLSLLIPRNRVVFLVQGVEWKFVKARFLSRIIFHLCKLLYRNRIVIVPNEYLESELLVYGIKATVVFKIWASKQFFNNCDQPRLYDVSMVVRTAPIKRFDLYQMVISHSIKQRSNLSFVVITPEFIVKEYFEDIGVDVLYRPNIKQMSNLYCMSKFFLLLSDHEGFGLPPLEAMGAGCLPIARDCGGVSAYMNGILASNIIPLDYSALDIYKFIQEKVNIYDPVASSKLARDLYLSGFSCDV